MNIVQTAQNAGNFATLLKAAQLAGLDSTLSGRGSFTVFAPTDDAFARIPKSQLNEILKDKPALQKILKFHVVPGKVMSNDIMAKGCAETAEGGLLCTDSNGRVGDANLVQADIECSNGVIHVIDRVLLPS